MRIRRAVRSDHVAIQRVLDGALLETTDVPASIAAGDVWVATTERANDRVVVGAIVCEGEHVEAIAVAPSRRGRGIGRALVEVALAEKGRLTADFRAAVVDFWTSLGFDVEERGDGRYWGVTEA